MTDNRDERDRREPRDAGGTATTRAWERTIDDLDALVEERERDGWNVVRVVAGHTAPTPPSVRDDERFGPVFVVPDGSAEPIASAFERCEFSRYEVYRETANGRVFLVVEYRAPREETAILIAGQYEIENASGMARAAAEAGTIYTRVQTLDGTVLGSVRHDEYEKFVPNAERVAGRHERDT